MYDYGELFENRMSEMEERYQVLSDENDKGRLKNLGLDYFRDLGYMLKRTRDLVSLVRSLERDNQQLIQELSEKRRVIKLNGVYDIEQLQAIIDKEEEWSYE